MTERSRWMVSVLIAAGAGVLVFGSGRARADEAPAAPVVNPGCLAYDPALVELTGSLDSEAFPTQPGYDEKPADDKGSETVYVLTLDKPICAGTENDVTTVQVEARKLAAFRLRHYAGRKVLVKGTLLNAKTVHHHTRVVLTVHSIKRS